MFVPKNKVAELLVDTIKRNDVRGVDKILKTTYVPDILLGGDYRPLHVAVSMGRTVMVDMLIKAGANVNLLEVPTGKSPLFFAEKYEIVKLLLDAGADVNIQDEFDENTVLHETRMLPESYKLILSAGYNNKITNRMGWNALHMQTAFGNSSNVELLLESGVNINRKNNNDKNAMDLAEIFEVNNCISVLERYSIRNKLNAGREYQSDIEVSL